ncbi:MAG: hypothetical protein ABEL51_02460 [Salinibacter sp.]
MSKTCMGALLWEYRNVRLADFHLADQVFHAPPQSVLGLAFVRLHPPRKVQRTQVQTALHVDAPKGVHPSQITLGDVSAEHVDV